MSNFVSVEIAAQPYYYYVQYVYYNVIGGILTLTFDDTPSSDPSDYLAQGIGPILETQFNFGFSLVNQSISFSGNTVSLTMPVTIENGAVVNFFYQGQQLPFFLRAKQDFRYTQPSIFECFPLKL